MAIQNLTKASERKEIEMLYTKFENKTIITGRLTAIDPLHIGAAGKENLNPIEVDNFVLKDSSSNPIIPGLSIKGVVRSNFEAILRSLDIEGVSVCDIFNESKCCMNNAKVEKIKGKKLSDEQMAQEFYDASCDVCKLFGGKKFAGKLHFKDCYYTNDEGKPCKYEKRDGVGIDRKTGAAARGAKYDFEVVPKGTQFDFELIAENLDEKQMGYLDFIINMLEGKGIVDGDYISVGGKTTRGLGRIRLENVERTTINYNDLKAKLEGFINNPCGTKEN